jgi:hypothetical protein
VHVPALQGCPATVVGAQVPQAPRVTPAASVASPAGPNEMYGGAASTAQRPLAHCASAPHGAPLAKAPLGGEQAAASTAAHVRAADSNATWQAASAAANPVTPGAPATTLHSAA